MLRHQRRLHLRLHEGRRRAGGRARPRRPAGGRLDRLAAAPRRASTGSTSTLGDDTWLFSTSGGTDLCTAFVGGVPILPVYRGELQARALGAAVEAWDEEGSPVVDEVGELVITEPMPSMPVFFWGDEDGSRYREAYFDVLPRRLAPRRLDRDHRARHRDHLRPLRLDDQPRRHPDGHQRDLPRRARHRRDPRRPRRRPPPAGHRRLDAALRRPARGRGARRRAADRRSPARIRERCSPRHVPDEVFAIAEVPRTLSGKVLEVPVKRILMGTPVEQAASRDSLANPAALDYFVEMAKRLTPG